MGAANAPTVASSSRSTGPTKRPPPDAAASARLKCGPAAKASFPQTRTARTIISGQFNVDAEDRRPSGNAEYWRPKSEASAGNRSEASAVARSLLTTVMRTCEQ